MRNRRTNRLALVAAVAMSSACGEGFPPGLSEELGFKAIVFAERQPPRNAGVLVAPLDAGRGARLLRLEPAALGGRKQVLFATAEGDVYDLEVSPDGKSVVFSARLDALDRYHIYRLDLEAFAAGEDCLEADGDLGPACRRLSFGPYDDRRPVHLADGRVAFMRGDPLGRMDFQGRGPARLLLAVETDGTRLTRLDESPGHHLAAGPLRDGSLRVVRWTSRSGSAVFQEAIIDPSGSGQAVPATQDAPGIPLGMQQTEDGRLLAACTPPYATWEAGVACRLGQEEWEMFLPGMVSGDGCSAAGRLRDPFLLRDGRVLASLAQVPFGCVNASDGDRGTVPDFSLAVLSPEGGAPLPLVNQGQEAETEPRPVMARSLLDEGVQLPAPPTACAEGGVVLEGWVRDAQGAALPEASRLRVLEALSGRDAPWRVELGGQEAASLCSGAAGAVASIQADGSFSLRAPADRPLKMQLLDRYGAAVKTDPLWWSGPACSRRSCSGCHAGAGPTDMASSLAAGAPPERLDDPAMQTSFDFRRDIQPILSRSCAVGGCHDAQTAAGSYVSLSGSLMGLDLTGAAQGRATRAYNNLLFVDTRRDSRTGQILESRRPYVEPGQARESRLIQRLSVPCRFDCTGQPPWAPWAAASPHPEDKPEFGGTVTDQERWLLVEWIDAGAPFVGRGSQP